MRGSPAKVKSIAQAAPVSHKKRHHMDIARIAALLEPFLEQPLPTSLFDQISIYIDLLNRWNTRINLTAIRQEEEIVTRHFGESFFLARHLFPTPRSSSSCHPERSENMRKAHVFAESKDPYRTNAVSSPDVLDIGSGAGFPAVPLKLWAPHIHLTLVESNHKKAAFLREVARALTLTNINVIPIGRNPRCPPRLPSSRSGNLPSGGAVRRHPPPSGNLSGAQSNLGLTHRRRPDPPPHRPDHHELAATNTRPTVTYKSLVNRCTTVKW